MSTEAFDEQLQKGKTQKFNREVYDVPALIKKYPDFFEKDSDKNTIRKPAKEDINNWSVKKKTEVVKEAEEEIYKKTGYLVAVEPGKGFTLRRKKICRRGYWRGTQTGRHKLGSMDFGITKRILAGRIQHLSYITMIIIKMEKRLRR